MLKGLGQPYVFVGGATVSLYASKPIVAASIRPTNDVDIVVELASYGGYSLIDERLRSIGFVNDVESGIICRYRIEGIIVDVMPTSDTAIGFSNRWYPTGFKAAVSYEIDNDFSVLIFPLPYFLASKWEAHKGRGGDDLRMSQDFEDIVYILEYCKDFSEQLVNGPKEVIEYFREELADIIDSEDFLEGVYAHMDGTRYGGNAQGVIQSLKSALGI